MKYLKIFQMNQDFTAQYSNPVGVEFLFFSALVLHVLQLCKTCMTDCSVLFSAPTQLRNFQFCVNLATTHSRGSPSPCSAPFLVLPNCSQSPSSPPCPLFSFVPRLLASSDSSEDMMNRSHC